MDPKKIQTKSHSAILLAALLVLTVVLRLPILVEPWGGDQAGFGFIGKGILEGKVPYKNMYSLTGYGIFFTFSFWFKLFGMTMASAHIGHLIVTILTVILVYLLTNYIYGRNAARIAALFYIVFSGGVAFSGFGYENKGAWGTYWYLSQRETYMAPLILGAIFLKVIEKERNGILLQFFSGVLIGVAFVYKQTALLMLFFLMGFSIYEALIKKSKKKFSLLAKGVTSFLVGFILAQLPFFFYFLVNDALSDVYEALIVHLSTYAKLSRGLRIETFFSGHYSVLLENLSLWLFAAISCLHIFFHDRNRNNLLIASWAVCSLAMVWGQGKFFGYHFILLVPPFAILVGYGLPKFIARGRGLKEFILNNLADIRKTFMVVTIFFSFMAFGILNYDYYRRHIEYSLGYISKEKYYEVYSEFPTHPYSFRADYKIIKHLERLKQPADKLGVIFSAGDTVIHFLTGMEPATRFIQSWYLFPSDETLASSKVTSRLRNEFIGQLINITPRFILCVHIPLKKIVDLPSLKNDPNVQKLYEYIQSNYNLQQFPDNRFLYTRI